MINMCLLDMDGILTNFHKRACEAHGRDYKTVLENWPPGAWKMAPILGLSEKDFYAPMVKWFWSEMEWMPDGKEILELVELYFGKEHILLCSAPTQNDDCESGKKAWIRREMPLYSHRYMFTNMKHIAAANNRVLIDDSDSNIDAFMDHGGRVIKIPRIWNNYHRNRDHALDSLKSGLDLMFRNK